MPTWNAQNLAHLQQNYASASLDELAAALSRSVGAVKQMASRLGLTRPRPPISETHRAKISAATRGRVLSPTHRERLSAAALGKIISAETRQRMSAAQKGRTVSAETRRRLSKRARERVANPDYIKKLRVAAVANASRRRCS